MYVDQKYGDRNAPEMSRRIRGDDVPDERLLTAHNVRIRSSSLVSRKKDFLVDAVQQPSVILVRLL